MRLPLVVLPCRAAAEVLHQVKNRSHHPGKCEPLDPVGAEVYCGNYSGSVATMLYRISVAVAWASLAFITYASLSPIHDRPQLSSSANIEHVAAFAFLGLAFCAAYRDRMTLVCSLVLGSAVVLELLQKLTPDRHARLLDASEKVVGGLLGILLASIALRLIERWTAASDV